MARPTSKKDLLNGAEENFNKLFQLIDSFENGGANIQFDFSNDEKKTEAHWGRDKNLRDVLIHLYEWHQLLLNWVASNSKGEGVQFLKEGYNWRNYGQMNIDFFEKHQSTSLEEAKKSLLKSHEDVMKLIEKYSNEELFTKGEILWTGGSTLGSYCVSATASHYDWAMKKLKAYKKTLK